MRFAKELVKLTRSEDLALQNKVGNTAPYFAAASGTAKIAEVMVNNNRKLSSIRGSEGALPLDIASLGILKTATARDGKGDTIAKRLYPSCGIGEVMVALGSVTGGLTNGEINQDSISTVVHCC
ncbi:hypothetical protein U1Q18_007209 [Sarracenia purpurea var. burkii]